MKNTDRPTGDRAPSACASATSASSRVARRNRCNCNRVPSLSQPQVISGPGDTGEPIVMAVLTDED